MLPVQTKTNDSFYETFSDLIFCTLVLFVLVVLILAMSVGDTVDAMVVEQEESQKELDSLLGTFRFTGRSGESFLYICADMTSDPPRIWPVPPRYVDEITVGRINETAEQKSRRLAAAGREFEELLQRTRSYTPGEIALLSTKVYLTDYDEDTQEIGVSFDTERALEEPGLAISRTIPGLPAEQGGMLKGDVLRAVAEVDVSMVGLPFLLRLGVLKNAMKMVPKGQPVTFTVERESEQKSIAVVPVQWDFAYMKPLAHGTLNLVASRLGQLDGTVHATAVLETRFPSRFRGTRSAVVQEVSALISVAKLFAALRGGGLSAVAGVGAGGDTKDAEPKRSLRAETNPIYAVKLGVDDETVTVDGISMRPVDCVALLKGIAGRGAVIDCVGATELPEWFKVTVLRPSGFISRVPPLSLDGVLEESESGTAGN